MPTLLRVFLAILDLSILVIVHEWGHLMAAKLIGVWPEEFGIGLPPKIKSKKIGETTYSLNALPFGGFVRLHGELADQKNLIKERAFVYKSKLARAFVALAGIFMNFAFAAVLLTIPFFFTGVEQGVVVVNVAEGSPSEAAGIIEGDQVLILNGKGLIDNRDFSRIVQAKAGETVKLGVERDGDVFNTEIAIRDKFVENEGFTGITHRPFKVSHPPVWQQPFVYAYHGAKDTVYWTKQTIEGFKILFGGLAKAQIPSGVAGPFGVTFTISEIFKFGMIAVLEFTAIISINLALINILPFPPLDGSRVVLLGVEAIVGKEKLRKVETKILEGGMMILLLLILVITLSEIPKLIRAGSISAFVESLFSS